MKNIYLSLFLITMTPQSAQANIFQLVAGIANATAGVANTAAENQKKMEKDTTTCNCCDCCPCKIKNKKKSADQ